mgnify:FL=1
MSTSFNFDYLPDNVLTLSFLVNEDSFDIFKYDIEDNELDALKAQLSFKLKNETFILKPGIVAGFKSLREALKRKANEQSAQTKKKRKRLFITNSSSTPLLLTERVAKGNNPISLVEHRFHVVKLLEK